VPWSSRNSVAFVSALSSRPSHGGSSQPTVLIEAGVWHWGGVLVVFCATLFKIGYRRRVGKLNVIDKLFFDKKSAASSTTSERVVVKFQVSVEVSSKVLSWHRRISRSLCALVVSEFVGVRFGACHNSCMGLYCACE